MDGRKAGMNRLGDKMGRENRDWGEIRDSGKVLLNVWRRNFFFFNFSTSLYKM